MRIFQEFREFAVKGNMMDMAVGLIMGAAFNKVVTSLVNDVFMPPIGYVIGGVDFKDLSVTLREGVAKAEGVAEVPAVVLRYGAFIGTLVEFVLVAFSMFVVVKVMNRLIRLRERRNPA